MAASFPGFPKAGLSFLRQLKRNNNREWFNERKSIYEEQLRRPMEDFVEALNAGLARYAPEYVTEPRTAVYRIYRDTRFSKDKTPYKTHVAALFRDKNLPKHEAAAFYVGISPEEVDVAGGVYMPGPEALRDIRGLLAKDYAELRRLLRAKALASKVGKLQGEALARPPKGYAADHAAADLLKQKSWHFYVTMDPAIATTPKLLSEIESRFRAMAPVVAFFNRAFAARRKERLAVEKLGVMPL